MQEQIKNLTLDTRGQGWIRVFKEGKLILSVVYEPKEKTSDIADILSLIAQTLKKVEEKAK